MTDLSDRVRATQGSSDADTLNELGCDLCDAGRYVEAESSFRRAIEHGADWAWLNLGNTLSAQRRFVEAAEAFTKAIALGDTDGWFNLGDALAQAGDLVGARNAYVQAGEAGDSKGYAAAAFLAREYGDPKLAEALVAKAAAMQDPLGMAVAATWEWDSTGDLSLEAMLRNGAELYPSARAALAELLVRSGRLDEAVAVLVSGADRGEVIAWLPLGNLYRFELADLQKAEEAYRAGIEHGDLYSHHNLAMLLLDDGRQVEAEMHLREGAAAGDESAATKLKELLED